MKWLLGVLLLSPWAWSEPGSRDLVVNLERQCQLRYRVQILGQPPGAWIDLPAGQGSHRISLPDEEVVVQAWADEGLFRYQAEKPVSAMASMLDLPLTPSPNPWRCGALLALGLALYLAQRQREKHRLQTWVNRLDRLLKGATALSLGSDEADLCARSTETARDLFGVQATLLVRTGPPLEVAHQNGYLFSADTASRLAQSSLLHQDVARFDPEDLGLSFAAGLGCRLQGGLYWLAFSSSRRAFGAEMRELVGLFRTQLDAALENQRLTRENAQSSKMAALGQMAGGLAHELNNPLGAAQLALDTAIVLGPGRLQEPLQKIGKAIARARATTDNFLYYIRGQVEGQRQPLNLRALLEETIESLEFAMLGMQIELEVPADFELRGYAHELQQAFSNLMMNARDAARPGKLVIRGARVAGTKRIRMQFEDSGPGVPEALRGQIFDPFFTTKAVGEGSGLGLVVARSVAEQHQGSLEYQAGAGFILELSDD